MAGANSSANDLKRRHLFGGALPQRDGAVALFQRSLLPELTFVSDGE
jgi:hypothetical protein